MDTDHPTPGPDAATPADHGSSARFWVTLGLVAVVVAATFFVIRSVTADDAGPATNVERNEDPGIDGIIATQAPASMFEVGDCLSDFTSPLEPATIVECSTRHDAQFIGTAALEQDIPYPGKPGTTDKAVEACKAIELNTDVLTAFEWEYHFSQPTADSWEAGDRTVACFLATTNDGDMATGTLLRSDAAASASS